MIHRRPQEGWLSLFAIIFGGYILGPGDAMGTRAYSVLLSIAPEWQWGLLFLTTGMLHGLAVWINGRGWWTPWARAWASLLMTFCYAAMAYGFWASIGVSTAIPVHTGLALVSAWCFSRAMYDCGSARAKHVV